MKPMGISQYALYVNFFSLLISGTLVYKLIAYFWPTAVNPAGMMSMLIMFPLLQGWNMRKQMRDPFLFDRTFFMALGIYIGLYGLLGIHIFGALPSLKLIAVGLACGIVVDLIIVRYKQYGFRLH